MPESERNRAVFTEGSVEERAHEGHILVPRYVWRDNKPTYLCVSCFDVEAFVKRLQEVEEALRALHATCPDPWQYDEERDREYCVSCGEILTYPCQPHEKHKPDCAYARAIERAERLLEIPRREW